MNEPALPLGDGRWAPLRAAREAADRARRIAVGVGPVELSPDRAQTYDRDLGVGVWARVRGVGEPGVGALDPGMTDVEVYLPGARRSVAFRFDRTGRCGGFTLLSTSPLWISPSILLEGPPRVHGYVEAGKWMDASDERAVPGGVRYVPKV